MKDAVWHAVSPLVGAVATWLVGAPPPLRFAAVAIAVCLLVERVRPWLVATIMELVEALVPVLIAFVVLLPVYLVVRLSGRRYRGRVAGTTIRLDGAMEGAVASLAVIGSGLRRTVGRRFRMRWRPVVTALALLAGLWYAQPWLPATGDWAPATRVAMSVQSAWTPVDCWVATSAVRWVPSASKPVAAVTPVCAADRLTIPAGRLCS